MDMEINGEVTDNSKRKLDKTILDSFSNIIKPQEGVRLKNSLNLLRYLAETSTDETETELNYAIGRIIRGLGSSAISAKAGFFSTLIGLLDIQNINIDKIFEYLQKQLHKSNSFSKGENADIAAGQILACGAIIRSQNWITLSLQDFEKIFTLMLKASKERIYLALLCYKFIIVGLNKLQEKQVQKLFHLILPEIGKPWHEQNLDTLYLLVSFKDMYPKLVDKSFLNKFLEMDDVICDQNLDKLAQLLLTVPRVSSINHPIYEFISKELATSELLKDFIKHIDNHLEVWNRNKILVLINIYTQILSKIIKSSLIPSLLSNNFIKHTLSYFKTFNTRGKDPKFKECIHNFFNQLIVAVKKDDMKSKTKILLLKKLLFSPGTFIFEKITKTKVIQHLTSSLDNDGVKNLAVLYGGVIEGTENIDMNVINEKWINNDRLYATHLLIKLLNHPAVKHENQWKVDRLCFLINLGFFNSEANVGCELAASLRTAFYGALNLKLTKLEDLLFILVNLVYYMNAKLTPENYDSVLKNPITENDYNTWQKAVHIISKIEKKKNRSNLKSVFLTLFVSMGLQLFNDSKLSTDSLTELFICYEKTRKHRTISNNSDEGDVAVNDNEKSHDPLWIEVVIDLFLNLLSHNSHLLRNIINCVFPHLCEYITPSAVHHILGVLDPKNENMLTYLNESSDDESDNEEVRILDEKLEDVNSEEETIEESDDDSDLDENNENHLEEDETLNDKLRMALHQVLNKNSGNQSDEESLDLDQMSETEGEELDKELANAFKQYRPNKGKSRKQNKNEEALTHFRIRVLDLVEIYLNSTPPMIHTLEIMLPLLQAIEFSIRDDHQRPLHNRLKSCLKKLIGLKKFRDTDGVDENVLLDLIKSLLDKGSRTSWIMQDMCVEIANCCMFIIKCSDILISLDSVSKNVRKRLKKSITEVITNELEYYFHKRDSITPVILFKNIMSLSWDGTLKLVPQLFQYVFKEDIKPFKRTQALELLKLFYFNQRYLVTYASVIEEALNNSHSQFSESIVLLFKNLCEDPNQRIIKEKFICNLFNLLIAMKSCSLQVNIEWNQIANLIKDYRGKVTFSKDAKTAFNKLCNKLGVSNALKRKSPLQDVEIAPSNKKVIKKRKHNEHLDKLNKNNKAL